MGEDDKIPWEAIDTCVRGAPLLKFGRQGTAHFREFALSADLKSLVWVSEKKIGQDSRIELLGSTLVTGQKTDVFYRQPRPELVAVSFSILYEDGKNERRTLDVSCKDAVEFAVWTSALSYLTQFSPPAEKAMEEWRRKGWATLEPRWMSSCNSNISATLKDRMKESGDVFAWGRGAWGELGLGDESNRSTPSLIKSLLGSAIRSISCGGSHCLALTGTGEVFSWGHGGSGRLGIGSTDHVLSPQQVFIGGVGSVSSGLRIQSIPLRLKAVAAGDMHTVGVDLEGFAWSWGCGANGQLGSGGNEDCTTPQRIKFLIASASAAISTSLSPQPSPIASIHDLSTSTTTYQVIQARNVTAVAAGSALSAFLDEGGRLFTCGIGDGPLGLDLEHLKRALLCGGLGNNVGARKILASEACGTDIGTPSPVSNMAATQIVWGKSLPGLSCVISSSTFSPPLLPSAMAAQTSMNQLQFHLTQNDLDEVEGIVAGFIFAGNPDLCIPMQVSFDGGVDTVIVDFSLGESHACACTEEGSVYTWGWGGSGALGLRPNPAQPSKGTRELSVLVPKQIKEGALRGRKAIKVVAGGGHCLAIVEESFIGSDDGGSAISSIEHQLETGGALASFAPHNAVGVASITGSSNKQKCNSLVVAWGANAWGQCGVQSSPFEGEDCIVFTPQVVQLPQLGGNAPSSNFNLPPEGEAPAPGSDSHAPVLHGTAPGPSVSSTLQNPNLSVSIGPNHSQSALNMPTPTSPSANSPNVSSWGHSPAFIAAGAFHSAVITNENRLYVFGRGSSGELGVNASAALETVKAFNRSTPRDTSATPSNPSTPLHTPALSIEQSNSMEEADLRGTLGNSTAGSAETVSRPLSSRFFPYAFQGSGGNNSTSASKQSSMARTRPFETPSGALTGVTGMNKFKPNYSPGPGDLVPNSINSVENSNLGYQQQGHHSTQLPQLASDLRPRSIVFESKLATSASGFLALYKTASGSHVQGGGHGDNEIEKSLPPVITGESQKTDIAQQQRTQSLTEPAHVESNVRPNGMAGNLLRSTLHLGPLPVATLSKKLVRHVACGEACTLATVATEWLSDGDAQNCISCKTLFSFTRRRHHCRRCGGVFCRECSSFRVPLLALGYIDAVRVCGPCYNKESQSKMLSPLKQ